MSSMYKYLVATEMLKNIYLKLDSNANMTYSAFQLNSLWGVKFCKCMRTVHCDTEAVFTVIGGTRGYIFFFFEKFVK